MKSVITTAAKPLTLQRLSIALLTCVLLLAACVIVSQQKENQRLRIERDGARRGIADLVAGRTYNEGYNLDYRDAYEQTVQELARQKKNNTQLERMLKATP